MFKSLNDVELIFIFEKDESILINLHVNIQFSQHLLKRLSFLHYLFLAPIKLKASEQQRK